MHHKDRYIPLKLAQHKSSSSKKEDAFQTQGTSIHMTRPPQLVAKHFLLSRLVQQKRIKIQSDYWFIFHKSVLMPIISVSYLSYTALVLSVAKKNMIWRHTGTFPFSWVHPLIYTVSIPEPLKQTMVKFLNKLIKFEENKICLVYSAVYSKPPPSPTGNIKITAPV